MPADAPDYIFDSFRQMDESDLREYQGTGLGLTLVKTFVEKLGGTICVETKLGQGTVFDVTLPCVYHSNIPDRVSMNTP